ncbi:hypothetical protein HID58_060154 [Brassica napus]|uniref:Uncharacterized protein n=1 Tax=Brassica napus TaxID=3708 RepID=A0ABQ7ZV31_BRANA|nr:hypothetical protein HID58_060154 [Brassica napus]
MVSSCTLELSEAEEVSSCTFEFGLWFSGAEMSSCTLEFWWGTAAESINVVSQRSTSVYKRLQASTSGDYRHLPYRTRLHGAEA